MKHTDCVVVGDTDRVPEDLRHLVGQLEEVAETIGVVRQAVVFWEAGKTYPTINNLKRLASLYGVTMDWLLAEETASPSKPDLQRKLELALLAASQDLPPEDMRRIFDLIGFLCERWRRRRVTRAP